MVPTNLRRWFVLHFIADMFFAIPLLLIPDQFLSLLSWETIDPLASRLVGAALMGIGFGAFVSRNAGLSAYLAMLNMKIIWSLTAVLGILASLISGGPIFGWLVVIIFAAFAVIWLYYRLQLRYLP